MFRTIAYRGHYIQVSIVDGAEVIRTHIAAPDGSFALVPRKSYAGAKRAIANHVRTTREERKRTQNCT